MPSARSITARAIRSAAIVALTAAALLAAPQDATAQHLGPFRQFLSVEPYYTRLQLDAGEGQSRVGRDGYGGRLWFNLAPFSGEHWNLFGTSGLGLFVSYAPARGVEGAVWHYGGHYDLFFANRPLGGVLDPFVTVGGGAFRVDDSGGARTQFALSPGGGVRIPIPNRFQLRADVRDAIIFGDDRFAGGTRTTHNLEIIAGLGLTF